ncbi:uncharacterized protein LDX57_003972 [Aspergillus melleus]|uniref:uncharacterized protein n=1 Tax=Aspergillus melleus TaxID=138277 RepID=UPI001E8CAAAB|nr:uncharacterized protein LDX57_003972 [Aspergillus melleus]KAH8426225.1 hypothetical protein LDX57_003972 [Aspergillus melleus]
MIKISKLIRSNVSTLLTSPNSGVGLRRAKDEAYACLVSIDSPSLSTDLATRKPLFASCIVISLATNIVNHQAVSENESMYGLSREKKNEKSKHSATHFRHRHS